MSVRVRVRARVRAREGVRVRVRRYGTVRCWGEGEGEGVRMSHSIPDAHVELQVEQLDGKLHSGREPAWLALVYWCEG